MSDPVESPGCARRCRVRLLLAGRRNKSSAAGRALAIVQARAESDWCLLATFHGPADAPSQRRSLPWRATLHGCRSAALQMGVCASSQSPPGHSESPRVAVAVNESGRLPGTRRPAAPPTPGEILDRYEVLKERLGTGATSDVFKGRVKASGKPVAVKVLDKLTRDAHRQENLSEDIQGARTEAALMGEVSQVRGRDAGPEAGKAEAAWQAGSDKAFGRPPIWFQSHLKQSQGGGKGPPDPLALHGAAR